MKKLILFLFTLAILIFVHFLVFDKESKQEINLPIILEKKEKVILPSGAPNLDSDIYQCKVDEDCVLVSVSKCCRFVAVNKKFKDEIKSTPMICTRACYTEAFYLATLGGTKALSISNQVGSLDEGKKADFLVIDHLKTDPFKEKSDYLAPKEILSKLIYRGNNSAIKHTFIQRERIKKG